MIKYALRRILYMVPTVFGVILITFVLFNVAGGDPAMSKLGKQATARRLEDYDLQRGYDKPLVMGLWGKTRAYKSDFNFSAAPWNGVPGAVYLDKPGRIVLSDNREYNVPLAFNLSPNTKYRWDIVCRKAGRCEPESVRFAAIQGTTNMLLSVYLKDTESWTRQYVEFETGKNVENLRCSFLIRKGVLEIRSLALGKGVGNRFDSQLVYYLRQIAAFDFGVSAETNQKVSRMIVDGIMPSLALTVPIFFIGVIIEVLLALICAYYRNMFIDRFFVVISVALMSMPYLVWIIGGQYFLAYRMHLFPVWGFESLRYIILPVFVGVFSGIGGGLRFYRTIVLDEVYRDYVRTAFAKGVGKRGVLLKHVLKNAMIPIITSVVMAIPFLYTGSLLLETFFGIPGLGNLSVNAILNSDFDVVRAAVLVGAIIYVIANLVTDLCYVLVDPRVRLK
jgi:peptide/nickel transport system permease protein